MGGALLAAAVLWAGITIKWLPFHSAIYPYSVSQPSSYRHLVLVDSSDTKVDTFFPGLGSSVTSVSIYANHTHGNDAADMQAAGGTHVRHTTTVRIMGAKWRLVAATFQGVQGQSFTLEKVCIPIGSLFWHLTISYAKQHKNQRPIMLHMISTFKAEGVSRSQKPRADVSDTPQRAAAPPAATSVAGAD